MKKIVLILTLISGVVTAAPNSINQVNVDSAGNNFPKIIMVKGTGNTSKEMPPKSQSWHNEKRRKYVKNPKRVAKGHTKAYNTIYTNKTHNFKVRTKD